MINKKSVFQRLIIYSIEGYLDEINPKETYNYNFMIKLRTAIRMYMNTHKFTTEEYNKLINPLSREAFMFKMNTIQIDRTIFALELLYLYVTGIDKKDRALLNIGDKKLLGAKSELIKDMLKLKSRKKLDYEKVNEIVKESRLGAKSYFGFCEEYLT